MKRELTQIMFCKDSYGSKEFMGSNNVTSIKSDDAQLTADYDLQVVTVSELKRDETIRTYDVPFSALCQMHYKVAPAAKKADK